MFCFFTLSLPHQQKLTLLIEEPSLLKQLNKIQKQSFGKRLLAEEAPELIIETLTPKGNFRFKSRNYEALFQHEFSNVRTEDWCKPTSLQHEFVLNSGLSTIQNNAPHFNLTEEKELNQSGIYGVFQQDSKLFCVLWSNQSGEKHRLNFSESSKILDTQPWQLVEIPEKAHGKAITLTPMDENVLDNKIDLSGFKFQNLNWSSDHALSQPWVELLKQQKMWANHQPLNITLNAPIHTKPKSLNFVSQPIQGFGVALPQNLHQKLFSTLSLAQSSRHHSLDWPLSKQPQINLLPPENSQPLWFNENHIFAFQQGQNVHTSLNDSTFKSNLNNRSFLLLLKSLYPSLNSPWLIKRDQPASPSFILTKATIPFHFSNLQMALVLFLSALLGTVVCYLKLNIAK
jgi:hypothetical protein